ncbi:MAG: type II toxin-antitoxin system prevent-host-death family antitoxin [Chloroflexi bacterium]|nr:type II toxin-antitoxin system prevent-host-death family antitoxin [Chloroflexota bacterium]
MDKKEIVGIRELKSGLSKYLRRVREGQSIVVTDRGEPVAEIRPIKPKKDIEAILLKLAAEGRVTLPTRKRLPPYRPVRPRGGALASQAIIEDREEGF